MACGKNNTFSTELGLYIHLPFCSSLCPYCDFPVRPFSSASARELLKALYRHLPRVVASAGGRPLDHLYLGGGTPSMLPAAELAGLVEAVGGLLPLAPEAEVTIEANPGTLSLRKLTLLRRAGFNRLSLGAQSFDPGLLRVLGRRHSFSYTRRAAREARAAGFANLSLDLIYGLPGQNARRAETDILAALELAPDHLSLYELTLGPGTPFGRAYRKGRLPLPDDDDLAVWEERALALIEAAGLARYEVSNFARPGFECRHNLSTWRGGDYLALGPGAHGHLAGRRWAWLAEVEEYAQALKQGREPLAFVEELTPAQRVLELVMLGLRTVEGVDLDAVARLLGADPLTAWAGEIQRARELDWARVAAGRLAPTVRGLGMADAVVALFI
jgi:oxygen-independent coproporphyrinogen-3 oxidase